MNADVLLKHYERIAEAPDAIARLRRLVLDLAVRGKLVPQDAGDEAAPELLKRIQRRRALVERRGRKARIAGAPVAREHPDAAPRGWEVVTLAELVTVLNGRAYKQHELLAVGTPVLRVGNLFTSDKWYYSDLKLDEDKHIERGDLIYAWSASFGPFIWQGDRVIYHYHIWKLALHSEEDLDKSYLYNVLLQKTREIKAAGHGISMVHMTKEKMERLEIPLPPLAEQHRIVAKVDELMKLCDRLEAARTAREATRDRLAAASLARLNAPDPETFPSDARFALDALPAVTTRPDQIKQLRQTILNLAVRGKLVPQDAKDDAVAVTLLRTELGRKQPTGRTGADLGPVQFAEVSFEPPSSWQWARLFQLCEADAPIVYGILQPGPNVRPSGVPYIRPSEIEGGEIVLRDVRHTTPEIAADYARSTVRAGDVVFTIVGTIGACAIVPAALEGGNITQSSCRLRVDKRLVSTDFLLCALRSHCTDVQIQRMKLGTAVPRLNIAHVRAIAVPVPPLVEQRRIVAKVDELMALCDALEQSLAAATTGRTRLLDATLAEALAPAVATQDIAA